LQARRVPGTRAVVPGPWCHVHRTPSSGASVLPQVPAHARGMHAARTHPDRCIAQGARGLEDPAPDPRRARRPGATRPGRETGRRDADDSRGGPRRETGEVGEDRAEIGRGGPGPQVFIVSFRPAAAPRIASFLRRRESRTPSKVARVCPDRRSCLGVLSVRSTGRTHRRSQTTRWSTSREDSVRSTRIAARTSGYSSWPMACRATLSLSLSFSLSSPI